MGRPVTCVIGIHAWQMVDYDHASERVTLECRKCGSRRVKHNTGRPDSPSGRDEFSK
jgi:hypothetical protein